MYIYSGLVVRYYLKGTSPHCRQSWMSDWGHSHRPRSLDRWPCSKCLGHTNHSAVQLHWADTGTVPCVGHSGIHQQKDRCPAWYPYGYTHTLRSSKQ